jgi:hypothetical protein
MTELVASHQSGDLIGQGVGVARGSPSVPPDADQRDCILDLRPVLAGGTRGYENPGVIIEQTKSLSQ